MANIYVRLSYDPTGRNPDNLIPGEPHDLQSINGFPYKIVTMNNGGFYSRTLRVYDASYTKLTPNVDYIFTYRFANLSTKLGLEVAADIVFLDPARTGKVYLSAQMVGGDVAFSLTAIADYISWFTTQPAGYKPREMDYAGNEPIWKPGELDKERWALDTYQPFNNEIYQMGRAVQGQTGTYEQDYRDNVTRDYNAFLDLFNDRLERHIQDEANPHADEKADVGLNLVENYALATDQAARAGAVNNLYLTPLLSWSTVDQLAVQPLNTHIAKRDNPHQTTPEKIESPRKPVVDATAAQKYLRYEQVANTDYFSDGNAAYSYNEYYQFARRNIPAANFLSGGGNGYIDPRRLGRGSPGGNTALNGDGQWVSWDSIIIQHGAPPSPQIYPVGSWASAAQGHQFVVSQPWSFSAPVGSMAFYRVSTANWWGTGNGVIQTFHPIIYGSYKSASGWLQLL
jgi:hypothetical protein